MLDVCTVKNVADWKGAAKQRSTFTCIWEPESVLAIGKVDQSLFEITSKYRWAIANMTMRPLFFKLPRICVKPNHHKMF